MTRLDSRSLGRRTGRAGPKQGVLRVPLLAHGALGRSRGRCVLTDGRVIGCHARRNAYGLGRLLGHA